MKKSEELKETLKQCLEHKKRHLIDKMVINYHTSEFRRQFKTKSPVNFHQNRATVSYEQELNGLIKS